MARILASWELGLRYGHVTLLNAIAASFVACGHQIMLAAKDVVTAHGIPDPAFTRILQAPLYLRRPTGTPTASYGQVIADGGFADPDAAIALVRAWLTVFDRERPDFLLAEHAPMSLLAAHVAGLPAVRTGSAFMAPPADPALPVFRSLRNSAAETSGEHPDAAADRVVRSVIDRLGGEPISSLAELLARAPAFLATWPELDHFGVRAGRAYYGPLHALGGRARPEWPAGKGPRAFVYLPFSHPAAAAVADALDRQGWRALWHSQDRPEKPLPASVHYSVEPIDMDHALAGTQVLIGRAGHATCAAALRHGVGSLLFPDTLEAGLLADRLVRAALAVVPLRLTAEALHLALEKLIGDPVILRACAAARSRYARYDPDVAVRRMTENILETVIRPVRVPTDGVSAARGLRDGVPPTA